MKSDLLDDLLPPPDGMTPAGLRELLRREKLRQKRVRQVSATIVVLLIAGVFLLPQPRPAVPEVVVKAQPAGVREISDEELVHLLGDQPVALVQWPGQEREYLVLWKRPLTPPSATGDRDPRAGHIPGG